MSYVKFIDNSEEVKGTIKSAILRGLVKCGLTAEKYAKRLAPVDTGLLRNSITYALSGEPAAIKKYTAQKAKNGEKAEGEYTGVAPDDGGLAVYVGTNVEYAAYVELGTGSFTEGGRPTKWTYEDDKGVHRTGGHEAQPFLKPAITGHIRKYLAIIAAELRGE
jgi:HK97 gp10 family phage protein|nr:MAG TPA_asm: putative tail component [Caudoviricetes sp.]